MKIIVEIIQMVKWITIDYNPANCIYIVHTCTPRRWTDHIMLDLLAGEEGRLSPASLVVDDD